MRYQRVAGLNLSVHGANVHPAHSIIGLLPGDHHAQAEFRATSVPMQPKAFSENHLPIINGTKLYQIVVYDTKPYHITRF
jgi:hypothetical protein